MATIRLVVAAMVLLCFPAAQGATVAATDALVQWRGRYRQNLDGSASFDWEGVQFRVQTVNSTTVTAQFAIPQFMTCKMQVFVNGTRASTLILDANTTGHTVVLAAGLDTLGTHEVNVYNAVEPAVTRGALAARGAESAGSYNDVVPAPTLLSVSADGALLPPSAMRPIKLLVVGDGVASGFGAAGPPCAGPPLDWSDHSLGFGQRLCETFSAECLGTIAWTGKGVLANEPALGSLPPVPSDFYQALGGEAVARDFDFNRPSRPGALIVALGSADLGGPNAANATFVDVFVAAYVGFALNLTRAFYSGYPTLFLCAGPHAGAAVAAPLQRVIDELHSSANITAYFVDLTGVPLDGCGGYPGRAGQAAIAARLQAVITAVLGWKPAGTVQGDRRPRVSEVDRSARRPVRTSDTDRAALWAAGLEPVVPADRPRPISLALPLVTSVQTSGGEVPVSRDLYFTVRDDGSGDFDSIQAALDFCNASDPHSPPIGHVTLNVLGRFRERVVISADFAAGVSLLGNSSSPLDALLVYNQSNAENIGTFNTHTLLVQAPGVTIVNMAVANDAAGYDSSIAGQSVALHLDPTADRFACFGCALLGCQDTLYTGCGGYGLRSYFFDTYINGTTDSVFGGSSTVLESSTLDISYTVTAGRGEPGSAYLILGSTIAPPAPTLLGRPWGALTTTVYKDCWLSAAVEPAGWDDWGHHCTSAAPPANATWCRGLLYAEFNSTGPGASPAKRVWWSQQLSQQAAGSWTRDAVLRGWDPVGDATQRDLYTLRALRTAYRGPGLET